MPVFDFASATTTTTQASLQNHSSHLRAQPLHCKVLSSPFIFGDEKSTVSLWRSLHFPKRLNTCERSQLVIHAVSTLPKSVLREKDGKGKESEQLDDNSNAQMVQLASSNADWLELDERERLRRMRISKANKGITPWNKGRKHSPETIQRIRERTRIAMQNPKVKMKLANLRHPQSTETREKIGVGVRKLWRKRHEKMILQETCFFEWQNLIAEASRRGYGGEEELQWNSYTMLSEMLEVEWSESVEQRKNMPRPKGSKRAPKSLEQRRKIAEAIAAKWADPEYRERVCSSISTYHGTPVGTKPKRRSSTQSKNQGRTKNLSGSDNVSTIRRPKLRRSKAQPYKDPLVSSKLEMIKSIRAQRAVTETKITEAIERARLLISEAQKAAKALEIAATKSPIAQASLIETRKLITEAIHFIESIDAGYVTSSNDGIDPSLAPTEPFSQGDKEAEVGSGNSREADLEEFNGTKILASRKDEGLSFANLSLLDVLNGEKELSTRLNGYSLPSSNLESMIEHSSSSKQLGQPKPNGSPGSKKNPLPNGCRVQLTKDKLPRKSLTSTKKWVRGRLVEVAEED